MEMPENCPACGKILIDCRNCGSAEVPPVLAVSIGSEILIDGERYRIGLDIDSPTANWRDHDALNPGLLLRRIGS